MERNYVTVTLCISSPYKFLGQLLTCFIAGLSLSTQLQVLNLSIAYADYSRVDLVWEAPRLTSDAAKTEILRYSVGCASCGDNVTFIPSRTKLINTRLVDSMWYFVNDTIS